MIMLKKYGGCTSRVQWYSEDGEHLTYKEFGFGVLYMQVFKHGDSRMCVLII